MAENFNLIFGSQAPTTATWTDADYQTGWSTVGSTPPTAEQFDFLQNRADTKAKELNDMLTPLVQKSEADGRQAGTIYASGACVTVDGLPNGWLLECVVPGTSGTVVITLPDPLIDGATITDGTVTWALRKVATNGGLGYRQPNTAYTAGQIAYHSALPTGYYLECTTAGTTSAGEITPSGTIGGTVTDGTVTWTVGKNLGSASGMFYGDKILRPMNDDGLMIVGASSYINGASVLLGGKDSHAVPGNFQLRATDGTQTSEISGRPSGLLTFAPDVVNNPNGKYDLGGSAIVAKSLGSNGYIKYASGLIVQWMFIELNNEQTKVITYPISFTTKTTYGVVVTSNTNNTTTIITVDNTLPSGCTLFLNSAGSHGIRLLAIGY